MMHYRTTGHLTDAIPRENVGQAQEYLTSDDMAKYLDPPLNGVVVVLNWSLKADGYNYAVDAYATRELTKAELKQLSNEVSGQNSDGLGEGFEQQDFAWIEEDGEYETCWDCDGGTGECSTCDGEGAIYGEEGGHMCSFDWQTNELPWSVVS